MLAFVLASILIPLWAYAPNTIPLLVLGAFLMQFMVQGAWGVIPAHLAELSPDSVRALLPGFAYQSAGIIASSVVYIEAVYAQKTSYATAMALTAISRVRAGVERRPCLGRNATDRNSAFSPPLPALRFRAALFACFDSAEWLADDLGSRFIAAMRAPCSVWLSVLRGFAELSCPLVVALRLLPLLSPALPLAGGVRGIPARLALLRPMAMACFGERAPCSASPARDTISS